ncbi:hypothetical protein RUM43_010068 [Polyplax serrata]|uniref:Uncharacterized protein n=1 Tax=Polyplax serrata TaxID=468196 RepID=A0AAN8PKA7_POLSC
MFPNFMSSCHMTRVTPDQSNHQETQKNKETITRMQDTEEVKFLSFNTILFECQSKNVKVQLAKKKNDNTLFIRRANGTRYPVPGQWVSYPTADEKTVCASPLVAHSRLVEDLGPEYESSTPSELVPGYLTEYRQKFTAHETLN